jgi:mannose-6-phosphate isomerase
MAIQKLIPEPFDKVWGSPLTQPWLANPEGRKIGEIWFSAPEVMPVLVKFIFTSDRLSVQVHPDDEYARAHGAERGKTEMWHILRAEADAKIALGLCQPVKKQHLLAAALDGDIVDLLQWIPVQAGETFFVPAGTIHAIGSGLVLCEIQQFSDVTYRLFDYRRQPERALHLDDSLAVADCAPADCRRHAAPLADGRELLAECEYFRTERLRVSGSALCHAPPQPAMYVAIAGEGKIAGEPFQAGEAWLVPADSMFTIESADAEFIIASGVNEP